MTCPSCDSLWSRVRELEEALEQRDRLIADLRRRLALYENPNTPPSRRMYPSRTLTNCGKRFPGRPRGIRARPDRSQNPTW